MGGSAVATQVCDGVNAKASGPTGDQMFEGDNLKAMLIQSTLNTELHLGELGIKAQIDGVEEVDGKPAWKVKMVLPTGNSNVDFYDQASGLKVKSVSQQGQIAVTTSYSDYREVDGILFPFKMTQSMGPQNFDIVITSIEVNKGVDDSVFSL